MNSILFVLSRACGIQCTYVYSWYCTPSLPLNRRIVKYPKLSVIR
jgi:transglutaminase-like putative cysteine protease